MSDARTPDPNTCDHGVPLHEECDRCWHDHRVRVDSRTSKEVVAYLDEMFAPGTESLEVRASEWKSVRDEIERLRAAGEAVLAHFMPTFPDSRAVDDCLVGLAAAVSGVRLAHETSDGWRPIETAPNDGLPVLITDGAYIAEAWRRGDRWEVTCDGYVFEDACHWMPIPGLPKRPSDEGITVETLDRGSAEKASECMPPEEAAQVREAVAAGRITFPPEIVRTDDPNRWLCLRCGEHNDARAEQCWSCFNDRTAENG